MLASFPSSEGGCGPVSPLQSGESAVPCPAHGKTLNDNIANSTIKSVCGIKSRLIAVRPCGVYEFEHATPNSKRCIRTVNSVCDVDPVPIFWALRDDVLDVLDESGCDPSGKVQPGSLLYAVSGARVILFTTMESNKYYLHPDSWHMGEHL